MRIADNNTRTKHGEEIMVLNQLIIDLKLRELGKQEHDPITMDRLELCTRMLAKLSACKEQIRFK